MGTALRGFFAGAPIRALIPLLAFAATFEPREHYQLTSSGVETLQKG